MLTVDLRAEDGMEVLIGDGRILNQVDSRFYNYEYPGLKEIDTLMDPEPGTFYVYKNMYIFNPDDRKHDPFKFRKIGEHWPPESSAWKDGDRIFIESRTPVWCRGESHDEIKRL